MCVWSLVCSDYEEAEMTEEGVELEGEGAGRAEAFLASRCLKSTRLYKEAPMMVMKVPKAFRGERGVTKMMMPRRMVRTFLTLPATVTVSAEVERVNIKLLWLRRKAMIPLMTRATRTPDEAHSYPRDDISANSPMAQAEKAISKKARNDMRKASSMGWNLSEPTRKILVVMDLQLERKQLMTVMMKPPRWNCRSPYVAVPTPRTTTSTARTCWSVYFLRRMSTDRTIVMPGIAARTTWPSATVTYLMPILPLRMLTQKRRLKRKTCKCCFLSSVFIWWPCMCIAMNANDAVKNMCTRLRVTG